jgi:hypothetical protein|tara:strand:+ start:154 stop:366 length:213 start_codon:yes stop_codon:yes gene_type:complete
MKMTLKQETAIWNAKRFIEEELEWMETQGMSDRYCQEGYIDAADLHDAICQRRETLKQLKKILKKAKVTT